MSTIGASNASSAAIAAAGTVACESFTQRTPSRSPIELEPMRTPVEAAHRVGDGTVRRADQGGGQRGAQHVGEHVAAGQRHVAGIGMRLPRQDQPAVIVQPGLDRAVPGAAIAVPGHARRRQPVAGLAAARSS